MHQPWKQWTWKQRTAFAGVVFPVSVTLFLLNLAVDTPIPRLIVFVAITVVCIPSLYIIVSANYAADRRHAEGDETAFSPRVRKAMARNEAKRNGRT